MILWGTALVILLVLASFGYNRLSQKYGQPKIPDPSPVPTRAEKHPAPDFTVQDTRGNMVSLKQFKGKPVVVNFWASWCPPCRAEMPDYQKMYHRYRNQGVVFMMVNLTDGDRETVDTAKRFIRDNHYDFPVYFDGRQNAANAYAISSIPDSIFITKDGNIASAYQGMIDAATMQENMEAISK